MRGVIKTSSLAVMLCTAVHAHSADISKDQIMAVTRNGEQTSIMGAPANFAGNARIAPLRHARPRLSQQAQSLSNPEHDLHGIPTQKARP
jgi:hypothetical protein